MDGNKVVLLACRMADTHPAEIFRVACWWAIPAKNWTWKRMSEEYKDQTARGRFDDFVTDFAIDLLAKRCPLWVKLSDGEYYVVKPTHHLLPSERWKVGTLDDWQEAWNSDW